MSTTRVATDLVVVEDPSGWAEASAVAGFLAAYGGAPLANLTLGRASRGEVAGPCTRAKSHRPRGCPP